MQQTDGPKVTFRESWRWHAAEEAGTPKLSTVPLFKFFGLTTTSKSEPDALTKEASSIQEGRQHGGDAIPSNLDATVEMPLISEAVEPQPIQGPTYLGSIQYDPKPDKEKSERDALTIATEFKTPEPGRENSCLQSR